MHGGMWKYLRLLQETEGDQNNEEDLTVEHRKHLRFFGIRWRYIRMSFAVLISICFAAAGIVLHNKQKNLVGSLASLLLQVYHFEYCFCTPLFA